MIDWLHEWPTPLGAGLVIACFLVPTLIGSAFLQPVIARLLRGEKDPNTPVALLLNAFTLYYGVLGGFKWSSQHLDGGGCDEGWKTALGSGAPSRVAAVAGPARRGAAG